MTTSIYKSPEGRDAIMKAYDESVAALSVPCEERVVETRFGETHLLICGPEDGPPLLNFHGGNSFNAETLSWYLPLARRFRIYAPDTVGHPGKSAGTRLSPKDLSYGEWADDVRQALGLSCPHVIGTSYGAGIALRMAAVAPKHIRTLVLVVPAGLTNPAIGPMMTKMVLPFLLYLIAPNRKRLHHMMQGLFHSQRVDPVVLDTIGLIFEHVSIESGMPRPAKATELQDLQAPALVIAAEHDLLFPASRVLPAARTLLPNLVNAIQTQGSGHYPTKPTQDFYTHKIQQFLMPR